MYVRVWNLFFRKLLLAIEMSDYPALKKIEIYNLQKVKNLIYENYGLTKFLLESDDMVVFVF